MEETKMTDVQDIFETPGSTEYKVTFNAVTNQVWFDDNKHNTNIINSGNCYGYCTYFYKNTTEKSKVEQAFRIVELLLKNKIVNTVSVRKFIELVNDISNIL